MVGAARRLATELVVIIARATQEMYWLVFGAGACGGDRPGIAGRYVGRTHGIPRCDACSTICASRSAGS